MKSIKRLTTMVGAVLAGTLLIMVGNLNTAVAAEIDPFLAEMAMKSQIVQQNKAVYDATATPLQKKVDKLITRAEFDDTKAVSELFALVSSTPDWSSNISVPLTTALPPRALLIKTGYRYDDEAIGTGDLRARVWVIEDGEVCSATMSTLPSIAAAGGFHEYVNNLLNHPTSGIMYINGNPVQWAAY